MPPPVLRQFFDRLSTILASQFSDASAFTDKLHGGRLDNHVTMSSLLGNRRQEDFGIPLVRFGFTAQQIEGAVSGIEDASDMPFQISRCFYKDKYALICIKLQRSSAFQSIIGKVLQEGDKYGHRIDEPSQKIAVLTSLLLENRQDREEEGEDEGEERTTVQTLRQYLVHQHVCALLEANGYVVHQDIQGIRRKSSTMHKILFAEQGIPRYLNQESSTLGDTRRDHPKIVQALSNCKYVTSEQIQTDKTAEGSRVDPDDFVTSSDDETTLPSCCVMDLKAVIQDQPQPAEDQHSFRETYSKNLSIVELTDETMEATAVLRECFRLQHAVDKVRTKISPGTPLHILHIFPYAKSHKAEQVNLAARTLSEDFCDIHQTHLPCGHVKLVSPDEGTVQTMDVDELYTMRESKMREASELKYGNQVRGETWNNMIMTLTAAGIKFDLLRTYPRMSDRLDISQSREAAPWRDSWHGVFVMYNYARLANLFAKFEEEVEDGKYLPLPPIENVDFALLKEEKEWQLAFNHLLKFPTEIEESLNNGFITENFMCQFETQKVCRFLIMLSRDLSKYYSRIRILVEPRSHLLPTMYARLYLLKAVKRTMLNGLTLLRITPLMQM